MGRTTQDEYPPSGGATGEHSSDAPDHSALIARELRHRTDNLFAVISSIIRLSSRNATDPQELADKLIYRIGALAVAHRVSIDAETRSEAESDLGTLVSEIVAPYETANETRFAIVGPQVHLDRAAITPVGLALHELCTNATKYGSLSSDAGTVAIEWSNNAERLAIRWQEKGGPSLSTDGDQVQLTGGSGTRIMRGVLGGVGGTIEFEFPSEGLVAIFEIPLVSR